MLVIRIKTIYLRFKGTVIIYKLSQLFKSNTTFNKSIVKMLTKCPE